MRAYLRGGGAKLRTPMVVLAVLAVTGAFYAGDAAQPQGTATVASPEYAETLTKYCVACHNDRLRTANLTLERADLSQIGARADVWEKVVRKLRTRTMPPAGLPRPDESTYGKIASWMESELDKAGSLNPNPGRPTIHRLNRTEYSNAIRDLFALDIDVRRLLPSDDAGYGFDNIADVLTVSPLLLERYLSAAKAVSRLAVGDPSIPPTVQTYKVSKYLTQEDRMSEDLPFGSRGGISIRHWFPVDGVYLLRIHLQRTWTEQLVGTYEPHQLDVRLDRSLVKGFTIGGDGKGNRLAEKPGFSQNRDPDEKLEFRFNANAGSHLVGVSFRNDSAESEGVLEPKLAVTSFAYATDALRDPGIDSVDIAGPFEATGSGDTASRRRLFTCRPGGRQAEDDCATEILMSLARRAYRRPADNADIQPLLGLFKTGQREGGFERGIQTAIERVLMSPQFLFRIEQDPAGTAPGSAHSISDIELASRLSFFLWSSIPDDQLLDVASRGMLRNLGVLDQQVRRMLADTRSKALVENFAGQWLYLRNVQLVSPDPKAFPDFDDNLRDAFQRETELFFESMLHEDRSVLDLIGADYTFLNERLARHYGIPNVYGSNFRRVSLLDENRRGLLGQGSILTATSYATRTSPVLRGKFLLDNILGAPPPPPPPNVPALKEGNTGKILTMRERMEQHRNNPVCASCHSRMDPLGLALEQYDAIGKWRAREGDSLIDASGALPNGTRFDGPAGLRSALLKRPEDFVTTLTEKLMTYALGRGVEYYDAPSIRQVVHDASKNDYRWSSLLVGIAKSTPFQKRRTAE